MEAAEEEVAAPFPERGMFKLWQHVTGTIVVQQRLEMLTNWLNTLLGQSVSTVVPME